MCDCWNLLIMRQSFVGAIIDAKIFELHLKLARNNQSMNPSMLEIPISQPSIDKREFQNGLKKGWTTLIL